MSTPTILAQAQQRLAESLHAMPPHKNFAVAITVEEQDGQPKGRLAIGGRTDDQTWQWEAFADYDGDLSAGGTILVAWGGK